MNATEQRETERLNALAATGILDSPAEASFDAMTRLAAEYFQADTVLLTFADESRVWVKSAWGEQVRELPRSGSIFDRVLSADGPVVVADLQDDPEFAASYRMLRRLEFASFAAVPVRAHNREILGTLTVFSREPRRAMAADELHILESLAEMAATQVELRRLRLALRPVELAATATVRAESSAWPRKLDLHQALDRNEFVLYYQPQINIATGEREAFIARSEGEKQAVINKAQGDAQSITAVAEATAQAIERIASAIRQPGGAEAVQLKVAEKAVEAYSKVAAEAKTTLIVPSNMTEVSALISSAMKMVQAQNSK